jgi:hypothetical protein
MELKKQGQILSLFLDERLINHKVIVSWVDRVIQESESPENWLAEISLSKKEDIDRIVYLLWTHFGYEYDWPFTEYVALVSSQYQKNDLPLHNCLIHVHHLSRDFCTAGKNGDCKMFKEKTSYLFSILDSFDYKDESIKIVEKEFETLTRYAQKDHHDSLCFINDLIDTHSTNIYSPLLENHYYQAKLQ